MGQTNLEKLPQKEREWILERHPDKGAEGRNRDLHAHSI